MIANKLYTTDGKTRIYVSQRDLKALRKANVDLWDNPRKAREMSKSVRKYVEDLHNLEKLIERNQNMISKSRLIKYQPGKSIHKRAESINSV